MHRPVIARLDAHVFRAPIATPVTNAFGTMTDRPMVLVSVEDGDGCVGWGEIWSNFPVVGAEHRARLVTSVFAPLLVGKPLTDPADTFARLEASMASQVLQTGEPGPFNACLAGIDQALTDLAARRAGLPLWRYLGGSRNSVRVYASGLGPEGAEAIAQAHWQRGFRAFKLKVGFGRTRDLANLRALRDALPAAATIMVDANQAWSFDEARAMARALADADLAWLEEPIAADQPLAVWQALANAAAPLALAAGENLCSTALLDAAVASGAVRVLQPDIGKWGGYSRVLATARKAVGAGVRFCPHWLAGGVGLMASLHVCAAAGGGDGWVEWDANPNPLRDGFPLPAVVDGRVVLTDAPGLGFVPDVAGLLSYEIA
ncbi:MAG TPA: mandelate racemase/muconate lactonizing enzyme family protein, partial [Casimicrobiaceae bacterium]|nr:mandelate racemase/muconate lactonizing enzyme family protein [Casimicrobiaceae bacterium]